MTNIDLDKIKKIALIRAYANEKVETPEEKAEPKLVVTAEAHRPNRWNPPAY